MSKTKTYTTPGGTCYGFAAAVRGCAHTLIAGASGSGKSTLLNSLLFSFLSAAPCQLQLYLVDLKRVELGDFADLPHVVKCCIEPKDVRETLDNVLSTIEARYRYMQKKHLKTYDGAQDFVIIDELADLMTTQKNVVLPRLQRICQIGRAAGVHIIAATQCPLAKIIPTEIKVNFDCLIGLRTRSAQDSRNILGVAGCELLPKVGNAYFVSPDYAAPQLFAVPLTPPEELRARLEWWKNQK